MVLDSDRIASGVWGLNDKDVFVVAGGGYIFQSQDAGATWSRTAIADSELDVGWGPDFEDVGGFGPNDLYSVGATGGSSSVGVIYRSVNDGQSWENVAIGNAPPFHSVVGVAPGETFAGAENGRIFHTTDRGETWESQDLGVNLPVRDLWASAPDDLYAMAYSWGGAYSVPEGNAVFHSSDHGRTWQPLTMPDGKWWYVWGRSAAEVYVAGSYGKAALTRDHGQSWSVISTDFDKGLGGVVILPNGELFASWLAIWLSPEGTLYRLETMTATISMGHSL